MVDEGRRLDDFRGRLITHTESRYKPRHAQGTIGERLLRLNDAGADDGGTRGRSGGEVAGARSQDAHHDG